MRQLMVTLGVIAGLVGALVTPAAAAGNKQTISLTCDGTDYKVTVSGNGNWTPARDNDSTLVFHPTSFGEFAGVFTPSDGGDPIEFTEPPEEFQAQPNNKRPLLTCSFEFAFEEEDGTFHGEGTATGYATGAPKSD